MPRFISKSSNLLIVLRPGLSAQPLTGTPSVPTISVRFKDGVADVPDGDLFEMMLKHPAFGGDFISAEVTDVDPYAYARTDSEPTHVITEMKFGSPIARHTEGAKPKLPPEINKLVQEMAVNIAKEMLPGMLESALKGLVQAHEADKKTAAEKVTKSGKPRGRPGRKPSVKKQVEVASVPTPPQADTGNPALVPDSF